VTINPILKRAVRIMIVDDEQVACSNIERILRSDGYEEIIVSHNVRNSVEQLEKNPCDIVLIGLLEADGLLLGEILRERYPTMPMVALSGNDSAELSVRAQLVGFNDFLLKPTSTLTLLRAVESQILYLDNRSIQNEEIISW
jgi:DNA-binding NtrC family response regulator